MTTTVSPCHEQLVARTRLVDDSPTSYSGAGFMWWHDGWGFSTAGVARRVPVGAVRDALAAIVWDGARQVRATGPVAVGALPFDPTKRPSAEMVIPARLWTYDEDGRIWLTEISGSNDALGRHGGAEDAYGGSGEAEHGDAPGRDMTKAQWADAVNEALTHITEGELDKVVLSRQVTLAAPRPYALNTVMRHLKREQPHCYVFAADGFVGATPELLVERRGDVVTSRPMAGTAPSPDVQAVAWLEGSDKEHWEHSLVVKEVAAGLARVCRAAPSVSPPRAEPFADLAHIVTEVVGRLATPAPSALELALALHPTPAVAGAPADEALALIAALETRPRGSYGGPVGWVDANGDGEFALALRCGDIDGRRAVLHAGAGIVAGSRWEDEWRETEAKLEPMRRALLAD